MKAGALIPTGASNQAIDAANEIDAAIAQHLAWTHRLLRFALLHEAPGVDVTAQNAHWRCALGHWLQQMAPALRELDPALWDALLAEHAAMHEAIRDVCASRPTTPWLRQRLADFERHQTNLVSALERLKTVVLSRTLTRDPLTQLPLRHGLTEMFETLRAQAGRRQEAVYALLLDLDHFKAINDTYGHAAGDAVLRAVAQRLREQGRRGEPLLRYGGEEFLLLFAAADRAQAHRTADRMLAAVRAQPVRFVDVDIPVSASAGLARHHGEVGESLEALLQRVDAALYEAKRAGRRRWQEASSAGEGDAYAPPPSV